jgi:3-oxoacyl-[acyl-carrier-protein] synthase II
MGRSGVSRIRSFDAESFPSRIAGEVHDFELSDYVDDQSLVRLLRKTLDRKTEFAVAAATMALKDSELRLESIDRSRVGIHLGAGLSLSLPEEIDDIFVPFIKEGDVMDYEGYWKRIRDDKSMQLSALRHVPDFATRLLSGMFGTTGPTYTNFSACAASTQSIGHGYRVVSRGDSDVFIAGGSDAMINPLGMAFFSLLNVLSTRNEDPAGASRPFDARRKGFVVGEGAGILILEEIHHALRRGAKIYGEIRGFGSSMDAHGITAPHPNGTGAAMCMSAALKDAEIRPELIDYINAHGTGTPLGDIAETTAIKNVFQDHAYKVPVSSTKSMIGHLLAAAGAVEVIASLLTMKNRLIYPTINYSSRDPRCDLDYVPLESRDKKVDIVLCNSFGFGGQNGSLIIRRLEN